MLWVVCYPPPPTLEKPTTFFFSLQAAAEVHTIQWKLSRKSSKACYFSTPLCTLPILYYTLSRLPHEQPERRRRRAKPEIQISFSSKDMMMDFFRESLAKSLGDGTPLSLTDYLNRAYLNSFWFTQSILKYLGPFSLFQLLLRQILVKVKNSNFNHVYFLVKTKIALRSFHCIHRFNASQLTHFDY